MGRKAVWKQTGHIRCQLRHLFNARREPGKCGIALKQGGQRLHTVIAFRSRARAQPAYPAPHPRIYIPPRCQGFAQFNRLINDDPVGNIRVVYQFIGANQQYCVLDGRERINGPIQIWRDLPVQGLAILENAREQGIKVRSVRFAKARGILHAPADFSRFPACKQPLIHRLQRKCSCAAARLFDLHGLSCLFRKAQKYLNPSAAFTSAIVWAAVSRAWAVPSCSNWSTSPRAFSNCWRRVRIGASASCRQASKRALTMESASPPRTY